MADSAERHSLTRPWQFALLAGLVIFAGRSALVFYAGSPVPFHDQWTAEGEQIIVHATRHSLTWHNFVVPNGDHPVVATKLITYALFRICGHWDTLAEMLVNNAIIAAAFGCLFGYFLRPASNPLHAVAVLIASVWLASPLFYGNSLWGFQSQIELLVLTAVLQIVATSTMETIGTRWWLATAAAFIGLISFGSAVLSAVTCLLICLARIRDPRLTRAAFLSAVTMNVVALAGGFLLSRHSQSWNLESTRLVDVTHTLRHALSWPAMQPSWFGLLLWCPALLMTASVFRSHSSAWLVGYACAVWALLQITAIAITRSLPVAALAPRYYDIFAVGVIANGVLCAGLIAITKGLAPWRAAALCLTLGWCGAVGVKGWQFTRSHAVHDIPAIRGFSRGQIDLLNRYYSGEGANALVAAQFPVRPHPDAAELDRLLADPAIKQAFPQILTGANSSSKDRELTTYGWPSEHGPTRRAWLSACEILGGLAAVVYVFLIVTPRFSRPTTALGSSARA